MDVVFLPNPKVHIIWCSGNIAVVRLLAEVIGLYRDTLYQGNYFHQHVKG